MSLNIKPLKKYRKKPIVIEAMQYDGDMLGAINAFDPLADSIYCSWGATGLCPKLVIKTLEGEMIVNKGDYIVRGVKGEMYPVKEDVFLETYEPVE